MARSLKKGPFADESLLKKVDAMNASNDSRLLKHGHVVQLFSHSLLDIQSQFMTEESMFLYMLQRTW